MEKHLKLGSALTVIALRQTFPFQVITDNSICAEQYMRLDFAAII